MRLILVSLLGMMVFSAGRASVDRIHGSHAVRSMPRRMLICAIDKHHFPAPSTPSRRDLARESALDEEADDLDSLAPSSPTLPLAPLPSLTPVLLARRTPASPADNVRRPGQLRC